MVDRQGISRRADDGHCDEHLRNSDLLVDHSTTLSQIKGGLIVAGIAITFIGTLCGGIVSYYVYQTSSSMQTLSSSMVEIHKITHENQVINAGNSIALQEVQSDIKDLKAVRK